MNFNVWHNKQGEAGPQIDPLLPRKPEGAGCWYDAQQAAYSPTPTLTTNDNAVELHSLPKVTSATVP